MIRISANLKRKSKFPQVCGNNRRLILVDEKKSYKRPTDVERLQKLEMQIAASEAELKKQKTRVIDLKAEMKKKQDLRQSKAVTKLGKEVFEVLVSHKYPMGNLQDPNDIVTHGKSVAELGETIYDTFSSSPLPISVSGLTANEFADLAHSVAEIVCQTVRLAVSAGYLPDNPTAEDLKHLAEDKELLCAVWSSSDIPTSPDTLSSPSSLSESEIALCKSLNAHWVSRDYSDKSSPPKVDLWAEKPEEYKGCFGIEGEMIASVGASLFPSLSPGDCVEVVYDE